MVIKGYIYEFKQKMCSFFLSSSPVYYCGRYGPLRERKSLLTIMRSGERERPLSIKKRRRGMYVTTGRPLSLLFRPVHIQSGRDFHRSTMGNVVFLFF